MRRRCAARVGRKASPQCIVRGMGGVRRREVLGGLRNRDCLLRVGKIAGERRYMGLAGPGLAEGVLLGTNHLEEVRLWH